MTTAMDSFQRRIDVDDGYVELVDYMGAGDLAVVNAARVSFGKRTNSSARFGTCK
jgi:hypothetical protein